MFKQPCACLENECYPDLAPGFECRRIAEGNQRLVNYIEAYQRLSDMPVKQLVDLALKHLDGNQLEQLLIEELCSRAYPGWENE